MSREQGCLRSRPTIAAIVVGTLVLAGCSGIADGSATSPTPTVPSTPTQTSPPTSDTFGENGTLEVHCTDVGQGSSTLLVGPTNEARIIGSGHRH